MVFSADIFEVDDIAIELDVFLPTIEVYFAFGAVEANVRGRFASTTIIIVFIPNLFSTLLKLCFCDSDAAFLQLRSCIIYHGINSCAKRCFFDIIKHTPQP